MLLDIDSPIAIELPRLPGAAALSVPVDAPGRLDGEILPPVLIVATLRALPASPKKIASWLLEIESDPWAQDDLRSISWKAGLFFVDGRWYEFEADGRSGKGIERAVAEQRLYAYCANCVREDLDDWQESPKAALNRIDAAYLAVRDLVTQQRAARRAEAVRLFLARQTWTLPESLWWWMYRDAEAAADYPRHDFVGMESWEHRAALTAKVSEGAGHFGAAPFSALLRACRLTPGLMLGVRSGVGLEPIDTRLIENPAFRLSPAGDVVSIDGMQWSAVCFDRALLMDVAPSPAVGIMREVPTVLGAAECISPSNKTAWLIGKIGGTDKPLPIALARELAPLVIMHERKLRRDQISPEAIEAEALALTALRRSFNRRPRAKPITKR